LAKAIALLLYFVNFKLILAAVRYYFEGGKIQYSQEKNKRNGDAYEKRYH